MMNKTNGKDSSIPARIIENPYVKAFVAALFVLGFALISMYLFGLLPIRGADQGNKALAAAIGLVGSVLSTVVTLVGVILKHSIDERNANLALQAEKRNRIETTIRAVDLIGENNEDASPNQIGGALLALKSLGEIDLAVALLAQLWPSRKASANVAESILRKALDEDSDPETQIAAASVLNANALQIVQGESYFWPIDPLGWRENLPQNCRLGLVLAAAKWVQSEIKKDSTVLHQSCLVLYQALADPDPEVAVVAKACLEPVVEALEKCNYIGAFNFCGQSVGIKEIKERLNERRILTLTKYATDYGKKIKDIYASAPAKVAQAKQTIDAQ
jgi:hypothetical protein